MATRGAKYESRNVTRWLEMADAGEVALPDFQRSWIWNAPKTAKYLKALFDDRPTGTFLILNAAAEPQFESRQFNGMPPSPGSALELVLDGQQRLTALWKALRRTSDWKYRFFVEVDDIRSRVLEVQDIKHFSSDTREGQKLNVPSRAFRDNLVPVNILYDEEDNDGFGDIWHWCNKAFSNGNARDVGLLATAISKNLREPLMKERDLWYCMLPSSTVADVAIEIFVETNSSSVKIKEFDIVVARARGDYGDDLRGRIEDAYGDYEVIGNYFRPDPEHWISDLGEWMLKVACLRSDRIPKESNYRKALDDLAGQDGRFDALDELWPGIASTLTFAAEQGAPTRRTLPSRPPLLVIAALHGLLDQLVDPFHKNAARQLVVSYYWRCLFSNRHEAHANDRLRVDLRELRRCLADIKRRGSIGKKPSVFRESHHPLLKASELRDGVPWIGTSGKLGRAVAAIVGRGSPPDWITGHDMSVDHVRELEDSRKLDRHHIFPRALLRDCTLSDDLIKHGLNGVLLSKASNQRLYKNDPVRYLEYLQSQFGEDEVRQRVMAHLVPYDCMWTSESLEDRYGRFLAQRAELVADRIHRLAADPETRSSRRAR